MVLLRVSSLVLNCALDCRMPRYMGPIWFTLETGQDPPVQANAVYGKQDDSGMHMVVLGLLMIVLSNRVVCKPDVRPLIAAPCPQTRLTPCSR